MKAEVIWNLNQAPLKRKFSSGVKELCACAEARNKAGGVDAPLLVYLGGEPGVTWPSCVLSALTRYGKFVVFFVINARHVPEKRIPSSSRWSALCAFLEDASSARKIRELSVIFRLGPSYGRLLLVCRDDGWQAFLGSTNGVRRAHGPANAYPHPPDTIFLFRTTASVIFILLFSWLRRVTYPAQTTMQLTECLLCRVGNPPSFYALYRTCQKNLLLTQGNVKKYKIFVPVYTRVIFDEFVSAPRLWLGYFFSRMFSKFLFSWYNRNVVILFHFYYFSEKCKYKYRIWRSKSGNVAKLAIRFPNLFTRGVKLVSITYFSVFIRIFQCFIWCAEFGFSSKYFYL